ncbi:hypothetical protein ACFE04_025101 [Oxalis oulophora]
MAKDEHNSIVFRVFMHCQGCSNKVFHCLQCFKGVEEIEIDIDNNEVTVKGAKADPLKVLARLRKKYSKNCELLSPIPQPCSCMEEPPPEIKEEPKIITVVFKMFMHCEGCVEEIRVMIERMKGILIVEPDMENSKVIVKGVFDPQKLAETIGKRLRKYVEILEVEEPKGEEPKQEDDNDTSKEEEEVEENTFHYPSQYATNYIYPCQTFSDENVYACIIM